MPTLPDYHQESPRYCTDLPPSCMCQKIFQIKWTFELFWALVWNLAHFFSLKIQPFFIHCMVSGTFFHAVTDRLFHHYNDESKFWLHIRSQVMATGSICGWGGGGWWGCWHLKRGWGVVRNRQSRVFRSPEVGISAIANSKKRCSFVSFFLEGFVHFPNTTLHWIG